MTIKKSVKKKINKLIYIEEEPFETLDIVEVAMNNDNNERKLSKQEEYNITSYENQHDSAKQNVKENQTLPQLGNMSLNLIPLQIMIWRMMMNKEKVIFMFKC